MALLFIDGFDHYVTADLLKKWTSSSSASVSAGTGRRSGASLQISNSITKTLPGTYATLVIGFAMDCFSTAVSSNLDIIRFSESATNHVSLRLNTNFSLSVMRGNSSGTVLGTTSASVITPSGFNYVEFKATIHDTTGAYTLKVNGVQLLTATSQDTRNGGTTGLIDTIQVLSGSGSIRVDDLYVCDNSGSAPNNDFLGDVRIDTLFPSADGTYSQFTCSTGTSHFALVDETAPNTTDYNESSTAGHKDSYQMQDLSAVTGTIYGVQAIGAILKDDAGARSVKLGVRSSTSESVGSTLALSTSQQYYTNILETNPATSTAWTEAAVNAAEALFEVV